MQNLCVTKLLVDLIKIICNEIVWVIICKSFGFCEKMVLPEMSCPSTLKKSSLA